MSVYSNNDMKNIRANDSWYKIYSFVPEGSKILDVGCSSGNLGKSLKKDKAAYVVGVDIDKEDVIKAKKVLDEAHEIDLEADDLSKLGTFDIIIMADVIEHLINPEKVLKKLKSLLNKNGKLVFSIPNMANVTTRIDLLKGSFEYKDFGLLDRTHLHYYDHLEVQRVFQDSGFKVVKTDCTIRIIPENILKKELAKIGIELSDKLKTHLESAEASTYQFIGYAVPSNKKTKFVTKTTTPLDVISKEIDTIREQLNVQIENLSAEVKKRDTHIKDLEKQHEQMNKNLQNVYDSKAWKLANKISKIKHSLLG